MAASCGQANKKLKLDSNSAENVDAKIYILHHRIQNRRLEILINKATEKGFTICDKFSFAVTHMVSGFKTRDGALKHLDFDADLWCEDVPIVQTDWLSECIKVGKIIDIRPEHILPNENTPSEETAAKEKNFPRYECQRATPLKHHNHKFTDALEILARKADLKDDDANYIRALAFRRAQCCLKSLSYPLTSMSQLRGMSFMGQHSKRVVQDILENGFSSEASEIENDEWYQTLSKFTEIYGVGKKTGEMWYKRGHRTIDDIKNDPESFNKRDDRLIMGLGYYTDLTLPVLRVEAEYVRDIVTKELDDFLPGCSVMMTGGFRRGKDSGHDADLLMSHPDEGREREILPTLLKRLDRLGLLVSGTKVDDSFKDDTLRNDNAGKNFRVSMDHFEKWMGVMKIDKSIRDSKTGDNSGTQDQNESNSQFTDAEQLKKLSLKDAIRVVSKEASRPRSWYARRVDLIVAPASQYYYAVVGWTGSKQFNRSLRFYADRELKMKLTSHGLYDFKEHRSIPASSEEEVFKNLDIPYREPHLRNC